MRFLVAGWTSLLPRRFGQRSSARLLEERLQEVQCQHRERTRLPVLSKRPPTPRQNISLWQATSPQPLKFQRQERTTRVTYGSRALEVPFLLAVLANCSRYAGLGEDVLPSPASTGYALSSSADRKEKLRSLTRVIGGGDRQFRIPSRNLISNRTLTK